MAIFLPLLLGIIGKRKSRSASGSVREAASQRVATGRTVAWRMVGYRLWKYGQASAMEKGRTLPTIFSIDSILVVG
jgi:hypothetical protein